MSVTTSLLKISFSSNHHAEFKNKKSTTNLYDTKATKEICLAEVSEHDHMLDCWIVVYDEVYDVTNMLNEHPGGMDILLEYAGRDATLAFRSTGHSKFAVKALKKYFIGILPLQERIYRKPGGLRLSNMPE